MRGYDVALIFLVLLFSVPHYAKGISVACMMAYDEGGAPAVYTSPVCQQWVHSTRFSRDSPINCHFATLQGHREYQEDRITCNMNMMMPFLGENGVEEVTVGVAAVFDGHGGHEASEMASKRLLDYLLLHSIFNSYKQVLPKNNNTDQAATHYAAVERLILRTENSVVNPQGKSPVTDHRSVRATLKEALLRTFEDIDSEFSQEALNNGCTSGSTGTVVLLHDGAVLIAHVGDSKALLCSQRNQSHHDSKGASGKEFYVQELTRDHHPYREDEKARIEAAGGFVQIWGVPRVNGILAMSRSIGDVYLKRYGVIALPEVTGWLTLTLEDDYLVISTDGVFETMNPQETCDLLQGRQENKTTKSSSLCPSVSSLAECIILAAFQKGSMDNLSAIVIPLRSSSLYQKHPAEQR